MRIAAGLDQAVRGRHASRFGAVLRLQYLEQQTFESLPFTGPTTAWNQST